jgi:hypothetical protein
MRTYQKQTALSTVSFSPHSSLLIPCQGARQRKNVPCYFTEIKHSSDSFYGIYGRKIENFLAGRENRGAEFGGL